MIRVTQISDPSWELGDHVNLFQGVKTLGSSPDSPSDSVRSSSERRAVPRYAFVATTEITDSANASKLSGRVTEISRKGCYVDIVNVLPVGTLLNLRISCDLGAFVTRGKVVYVQESLGMGVVFLNPPKDQLEILYSWLAKLLPPSTQLERC